MAEEAVTEQDDTVQQPDVAPPSEPPAKKVQGVGDTSQKQGASHLLKVWYMSMIFCILGLVAIGVLFQDDSVFFYVFLGVVTLCITPVIRLFSALANLKRLNELNAALEQKRLEEQARLKVDRTANMTFEELQELEREKTRAATELAKRHAAKEGKEAPLEAPQQV